MSFALPRCPIVKPEQHQQAVEFGEAMNQQSAPAASHFMPVPPPILIPQNTSDQIGRPQQNPVTLASDWIVHVRKRDGKRFYHNIKTRESTWYKPWELMTLNERADSTTNWQEVITKDRTQKYYYNVVTKRSTWTMPQEMQFARTKFLTESSQGAEVLSKKDSDIHVAGDDNTEVKSSAQAKSAPTSGSSELPVSLNNAAAQMSIFDECSIKDAEIGVCEESGDAPRESTNNAPDHPDHTVETVVKATNVEQKVVNEDTENVVDAKTAFKALLESVNVRSDWTWNQAMKLIINDKRYAALTPHAKRTKTFDEFLKEKQQEEASESRATQKIARKNFRKMLEESKELTVSTRWRKAITIFEHDERFMAIERAKDREDMLQAYLDELQAKELKLRRQKRKAYVEYLRSCDFIKSSSKWKDVGHLVEADKRCISLDSFERFELFKDYVNDLHKEEVLRAKEIQIAERKNRYEFRKLMDEHIAAGKLDAKTHWDDFYMEVRDLPAYKAVLSNSSGATTKELFKIVLDGLKQKMIYEEKLKLEKAKEEERRQHLVRDFNGFLHGLKEITSSSTWENCNSLFKERFRVEKGILKETFQNYVLKVKENEEREKKQSLRKMKKESKLSKQKRKEYVEYLRCCDFIKSSSKWKDVGHLVEADKRCSILDPFKRFQIFKDYVNDLQKKEVLRMKEIQIAERKNRYEFRKLMDEHIAAGKLDAKTCWDDFYMEVKDSPVYKAVSSNSSGATTKELFEIVLDDLQQKMIYESELKLKKAKEEERRQHLVRDFYEFLHGLKEITSFSTWEDCNLLFKERFRMEEGILKETFQNYVLELKENEREKKRSLRKMKKVRKNERRKEKDIKKEETYNIQKKPANKSRKQNSKNKKRQWSGDENETGRYRSYRNKRQKKHQ